MYQKYAYSLVMKYDDKDGLSCLDGVEATVDIKTGKIFKEAYKRPIDKPKVR